MSAASASGITIERLGWDSAFFGFGVGRLLASTLSEQDVESVQNQQRERGFHCVYFEADPNDYRTNSAAQEAGFVLVDVRVVFSRKLADSEPQEHEEPSCWVVDPYRRSDLPTLRSIAAELSAVSRFSFDLNFPSGSAAKLYELWVERSCAGMAEQVLVAHDSGEPCGFITCERTGEVGRMPLVAVTSRAHGLGIGSALLGAAISWFSGAGVETVQVATQARNLRAQNLYQAHNFRTSSVTYYYHRWIEGAM